MTKAVINAQLLKGKIVEKGTNVATIAKKLGVDKATLYRHMNTGGFSLGEVVGIKELLDLTEDEAIRIFFGSDSHNMRIEEVK